MIIDLLAHLGSNVRSGLAALGAAACTFADLITASSTALRRPRLVTDQVHFIGNYSLVIIAVSGLLWVLCLVFRATTHSTNTVPSRHWVCWWRCR